MNGLHAYYSPAGWDSSSGVWQDESGNLRDSVMTIGSITKTSQAGNGAKASIWYLEGGPSDSIVLPPNSLPSQFTICSVTRYSSATGARGRIISATSSNFLHGHYNGNAGVSAYNLWVTRSSPSTVANSMDWVVMCGQNAPSNSIHMSNGVVVTAQNGGQGDLQLRINNPSSEPSYWQVHSIAIWARHLALFEIQSVSDKYLAHLDVNNGSEVNVNNKVCDAACK